MNFSCKSEALHETGYGGTSADRLWMGGASASPLEGCCIGMNIPQSGLPDRSGIERPYQTKPDHMLIAGETRLDGRDRVSIKTGLGTR